MSFPNIGQILFMYIETEPGQSTEFKTRLVDESPTHFFIDFPINVLTNESSYVGIGKKFRLEYVLKSGNRYFFESEVEKHIKKGIHVMVIKKPDLQQIHQVQRRSFFRIEIDVDIAVLRNDHTRKVYRTEDIGGGGISLIAGPSDTFEKDEEIECWMLLPYKNGVIEHANFKAQVVRVKEDERGFTIVMLRYIDISETERQRIIRFSFAKQIEMKDKV